MPEDLTTQPDVTTTTTTTEVQQHVSAEAAAAFRDAMKFAKKAIVIWLVAVFLVISAGAWAVYAKIEHVDAVVTSHNTALTKTLDAACVLIRSDPKLPTADCPPAVHHKTKS